LILELGLRYRPPAREDIEVHNQRLALLAGDLADVPPEALRQAIDRWAVTKPYLPKASELIELAQATLAGAGVDLAASPQDRADARNARLEDAHNFRLRWVVEGGMQIAVDYETWLASARPDDFARLQRARWQWLAHVPAQDATP
jgi:hypothetical protein